MVFEKVRNILSEYLEVDEEEITMDSRIVDDLSADSLDLIDIIMAFEDEFDTEFNEEDADSLKTVADVVNYIEQNS